MHPAGRATRSAVGLVWAVVALAACEQAAKPGAGSSPSRAVTPQEEERAPAPRSSQPAPPALAAGAEIAIPKGTLSVGSTPGSAHRNPALEADNVPLELPAFAIDALPFPNDPAKPPRTLTTRAEAADLCASQGKRLCSELEWERACKGDAQREYPSEPFDAASCASDPATCPSPFGVRALGTGAREWTASDASKECKVVVRGAAKDAPTPQHRCAARGLVLPDERAESLAFRCCRGELPQLAYPVEDKYEPFVEQELSLEAVRALLAAMPETAALAGSFRPFRTDEVARKLSAQDHKRASLAPWIWTTKELLWSPSPGERVAILAGDTPEGALLVAFHPSATGGAHFAASYTTKGEHEPIVVAFKTDAPGQVLFSTCWGCGGEGGALEIGSDARVRIALR